MDTGCLASSSSSHGSNSMSPLKVRNATFAAPRVRFTSWSRMRLIGSYRWLKNTALAPASCTTARSSLVLSGLLRTISRLPRAASACCRSDSECLLHQRLQRPGWNWPSSSGAQMKTGTCERHACSQSVPKSGRDSTPHGQRHTHAQLRSYQQRPGALPIAQVP